MREVLSEDDKELAINFAVHYLQTPREIREIKYKSENNQETVEEELIRDFYSSFKRSFPETLSDYEEARNLLKHFNFWKKKRQHSIDAFRTPQYITRIQEINKVSLENALSFPAEELDTLLTLTPFLDKREEEEHGKKVGEWERNFRAADKAQQILGLENA